MEIRNLSDITRMLQVGVDEDKACRALDMMLPGGSNVQALQIVNLVYVLRSFVVRRGNPLVRPRGRQVQLQ